MRVQTADALILRTYRYGEADRIVVFLTEDRGKKRGVAKNATKSRRRFGGALEPLTRGRVAFDERAPEGQANERLFRLGAAIGEALCRGGSVEALARYFEYWLLRLEGVY